METESVRLFGLATERLNISAAGRELVLAPAVASARLAKPGNALGAEFLPFARAERGGLRHHGSGPGHARGNPAFTAPSTFAQLYLAPIVPDFLELHPGIDLDLRLSDIHFDLISGNFDLALRNAPLADSSLKRRKLADDARILCAAPACLARHGHPATPDDLTSHRLVGCREQAPRHLVGKAGETGQFDPKKAECRLVVVDGLSHKIATIAGAGISINSMWSVHRELADGTLVRVRPGYEVDDNSVLWLVYPRSNVLTAKARIFIDFLPERIGRVPAWEAEP